jgi:CheY-like chemotaxis protein
MPPAESVVVLVVDDESPVREFLRRWLQAWGYAVTQAGNATEALEVMLADPASIMLCDIKMPGHDGLWLAERVREKWPQTAIIMATALDDLPTVLKSRQLGAVDYVTKPFGRELLLQALNRAHGTLNAQNAGVPVP